MSVTFLFFFFFSSRRRHTRCLSDWSSDVCSSDLVDNPQAELIFRKGLEHERAYLDSLRAAGRSVTEIALEPDLDWGRAARETREAIASGVDVVYQGVFVDEGWRGVGDFLERQDDGTYEAVDTKLARSAKPAYV